jgi:hypothetical protein
MAAKRAEADKRAADAVEKMRAAKATTGAYGAAAGGAAAGGAAASQWNNR